MRINVKTIRILGVIATLAGFALELLSDYCRDYCGEIDMNDLISQKVSEGIAKELGVRRI